VRSLSIKGMNVLRKLDKGKQIILIYRRIVSFLILTSLTSLFSRDIYSIYLLASSSIRIKIYSLKKTASITKFLDYYTNVSILHPHAFSVARQSMIALKNEKIRSLALSVVITQDSMTCSN
jgi:hypothetical protein